MSYFIFKSIKSSDMHVYVEQFPPIVKPPIRHEVIEFDGSDYTEVEELGYQTYEKVISIGYRNTYHEEVYNWLQGEGQLTLSDEPDKYYRAKIIEKIDYDKALSFRKARVYFTVQPHKYLIDEYETQDATVINQGNTYSLPKITVYGNGQISLLINGIEVCKLNVDSYITVDSELQEAYKENTLKNRSMTGNFPKLDPGPNTIGYIGDVTTIITLPRSRWV